jgi:hypothetical protein
MNKMLLEQLHRYTEDREIDYFSAQYLGESFGIIWKNQQQLVEFKQAIDTYLKTFSAESFAIIESKVNVLTGKNTRTTEEAEQLTVYAAEPKTLRKPGQRKVLKNKKKVNEEIGLEEYTFCPSCGKKTLEDLGDSDYNGIKYFCHSCRGTFDIEGSSIESEMDESHNINELRKSGNLSPNISVRGSHTSGNMPHGTSNLYHIKGEMYTPAETARIVANRFKKAKVNIDDTMSLDDKFELAKKLKLI